MADLGTEFQGAADVIRPVKESAPDPMRGTPAGERWDAQVGRARRETDAKRERVQELADRLRADGARAQVREAAPATRPAAPAERIEDRWAREDAAAEDVARRRKEGAGTKLLRFFGLKK